MRFGARPAEPDAAGAANAPGRRLAADGGGRPRHRRRGGRGPHGGILHRGELDQMFREPRGDGAARAVRLSRLRRVDLRARRRSSGPPRLPARSPTPARGSPSGRRCAPATGPCFGAARGRNLIVVQVESMQDFVVDYRVNGQDVMPHLRRWTTTVCGSPTSPTRPARAGRRMPSSPRSSRCCRSTMARSRSAIPAITTSACRAC